MRIPDPQEARVYALDLHRPVAAVLPALFAIALAGCGTGTGPEEGSAWTVEGIALADSVGLDPGAPKPLSGVQVSLRTPPNKLGGGDVIGSAVTGSDGRFSLRVTPGQPKVCSSLLSLEIGAPDYEVWKFVDFDPGDCLGTTGGVVIRLIPSPSFRREVPVDPAVCRNRPPGWVCLGFEDGFIWMVNTPGIRGWREGRPFLGDPVTVAVGHAFEFHHILNTDQVARVRLP